MSLSVPAVTDSRIVVRSLPSCAVVGWMDAAGGSYYQLEFGHDGFHRIRQRGGWDASLIMPPTTHACDSLPATATISPDLNQSGSSDVRRVAGVVAVFCVSLLMFGRRRRLGLLPRGR